MQTDGRIILPCSFATCIEQGAYEVVSECGFAFLTCKQHASMVEKTLARSLLEEVYLRCPGDVPCREGKPHNLHPYGLLLGSLN